MEDHKRKSKKRNQNKRPTADQIKKLQSTFEQKKEKGNGTQEESRQKISSEKSFENSHDVDLKVANLSETNGNNKKNKKKNKQKNKQPIESVISSKNGHLEDEDLDNDLPTYNGVDTKEENEIVGTHKTISDAIPVTSQSSNRDDCSQERVISTSNCHQYHGNEAPTCSHHNQHHMSNINMADLKIDIDVQKLSSETTSFLGSHQEYYYKDLNMGKLKIINNEATGGEKSYNPQYNSIEDKDIEASQLIKDNIGMARVNEHNLSFHNIFSNIERGSKLNEPEGHAPRNFDPNIMMKNMFAKQDGHDDTSFNPNEFMKNMFGSNESQSFNPQEILKSMLGGEGEQVNSPINPFEIMNQMFGGKEKQEKPINPNELLQNMFGGVLSSKNTPDNPVDMFKNIIGKEENQNYVNQPLDIQMPDMFSQMNEMAQNIDPTLMSSMTQIVANMDPSILMGVNNMVADMMQNGGFQETLQNLKQTKNKSVQEREAKVFECSNNQSADPKTKKDIHLEKVDSTNSDIKRENKQEQEEIELSYSVEDKSSNIIHKSSYDVSACKKHDENSLEGKNINKEACSSGEKTEEPFIKDSLSEPSEKGKEEVEQVIQSDIGEEDNTVSKKVKRFVREESIPELLENLTKKDVSNEIKIQKIEIKTNKFKTILNKVLRKEKKCVEGSTSKVQVYEERIECQTVKKPKRANVKESTPIIVKEIDYEKLQHVKEPLETREKEIKNSKTKIVNQYKISDQVKEIENEKADKKLDETGEFNKYDSNLLESKENCVPDEYIEFNPESVNELFTNLLQGKKMLQEKIKSENTAENSEATRENPEGSLLKNFSSLFESQGFKQIQGENMNASSGLPDSENENMIPFSMMMQNNMSDIFGALSKQKNANEISSGSSEVLPDELVNFKNITSQMLSSFTFPSSDANQNPNECSGPTGNHVDLFQNLQQAMIQQFSTKTKEDENQLNGNIMENMSDMFEKMMSNKGESTFLNVQNIFKNEENMKGILQMGQMLFGKSPFDTAEVKEEGCKKADHKSCEDTEKLSTSNQDLSKDDEEVTVFHCSKNVYQHERPSVLLKELLGEEFWSIRKKRTDLIKDINTKSKIKNKNNIKRGMNRTENPREITQSVSSNIEVSSEPEIMPFDLQKELEKESPLVRMLHKKIQKDTKLQQFLKEKLQKDPKMQKFIQERLQKDERVQKFMREKLAKDKTLRKTFEDKLKNDLGLTNFLPKFDDDDNDNIDEVKPTTDQSVDDKRPSNLSYKQFITEENKGNIESSVETAPKKNTGLLLKKYAELTFYLVGIVYMGILCY